MSTAAGGKFLFPGEAQRRAADDMHGKNDVNIMPTDPLDPSSPKPATPLYQTTSDAPRGGGGGIFVLVLLLLLLGGAAAYYFLVYKPGAVAVAALPSPTPAATAAASMPAAVATPDVSGNATYGKTQRQEYIQTAIDSFKTLRQSKSQPFTDAFSALMAAGGFSAASLGSKDAITARRDMVKRCVAANDDYIAFIKDQEAAYTGELKKTPLIPNDVEVESSYAGAKMPTDKIVQLRTLQGDSLKTGDQMLAYLGSTFGSWSINAEKHIVFKKTSEAGPFSALAKTYSEQVASLGKLRDEVNTSTADPTASSPAAGSPTPTPAPTAVP